MVESNDSFKQHFSKATESDSLYYEWEEETLDSDVGEGSQETQSRFSYVKNVAAINAS